MSANTSHLRQDERDNCGCNVTAKPAAPTPSLSAESALSCVSTPGQSDTNGWRRISHLRGHRRRGIAARLSYRPQKRNKEEKKNERKYSGKAGLKQDEMYRAVLGPMCAAWCGVHCLMTSVGVPARAASRRSLRSRRQPRHLALPGSLFAIAALSAVQNIALRRGDRYSPRQRPILRRRTEARARRARRLARLRRVRRLGAEWEAEGAELWGCVALL